MILLKFLAVSQLSYFLCVSIVGMLPCSDVATSPGILGDTLAIPCHTQIHVEPLGSSETEAQVHLDLRKSLGRVVV